MILDEIVKKTADDLKQRMAKYPLEWLGRSLAYNPYVPRDVLNALKSTKQEPLKIIAEVKKASPSKGVIRQEFEPILIAKDYEAAGANAISVLSEPHYFQGNLEFITQIRRYVATVLLRKDFIIDRYQILEALVYGADFILLIAKILSKKELKELVSYAHHLGLEVLVETHDKEDIIKAIFAGANIIGINHRDLQSFEMDMGLCERLIPLIPNSKIIIAESGLTSHEQLVNLNKIGVDAFLIGEHFMRQDDIKKAVIEIKEG